MADSKISTLTAVTAPLGGTEVLPIVQDGVTKKVTVADLTAGRSMNMGDSTTTVNDNGGFTIKQSGANQTGYLNFKDIDDTNAGRVKYDHSNNALQLIANGVEHVRVKSNGDVAINSGNIEFISGKGIDFSADNPDLIGMTGELLDDYEEGTWTPTLSATTVGDLSVTYSSRVGTYTKVGRLVTAACRVITSAFTHTTAADDAQIQGLPFAARSLSNMRTTGPIQLYGANKTGYTQVNSQIESGSSSVSFVATGVAGSSTSSVKITEMPSGGTPFVTMTVVYETDA